MPVQRIFGGSKSDADLKKIEFATATDVESLLKIFLEDQNEIFGVELDDGIRRSLIQALRARRLVLLVDGVDEGSSYKGVVERFIRMCVDLGLCIVASSRPGA